MDKKSAASGEKKLSCEDVSKCFQLLESILDGEHTANSKEVIDEKLAKCAPCFQHYHLEQAIREVLKTKCTKQSTPAELVANIREKIQELK
ncbi:RNA polymerase sigma factor RpoE [Indibacter alkaliphilus LW1]|jgi:anti-sigma factor (TIGR02949 family)|uniref:RNA polymerase sigma factor RpoE n=1 Tax=Indibacter alkaliphilus (strain CCUG 57479 / KCTC 22604 / LW1) TaxID=1189612 RepID=S2EB35_INDAL|nr:mycothiol system anti-sigma-R factor [Indibacter alkaliphilus]EOZ99533.1 RNA polymerase sigma factor RpoE [Indibacter alkaliphilus LW1]